MSRRLRRIAIVIVATLAACYIAVGIAGVLVERPMLFPGAGPGQTPVGGQLLRVPAHGSDVIAFYIPPRDGQRVVVHFHGNAEQVAELAGHAQIFTAQGLGFFAVEYPGYGLAAGEPTERSIYDSAEIALQYLRDTLQIPVSRTVIEGHSLGAGVGVEMALRGHCSRLLLISPYTCVADLGRALLPYHPRRWLVRDPFDSESKAARITVPTLILHGTQDRVVPAWMGSRLGTLFPHSETRLVEGAGHNDLPQLPQVVRASVAFALAP